MVGEASAAAGMEGLSLFGSVDNFVADTVNGWVWSSDQPNLRRQVLVYVNGAVVAEGIADGQRADLADAGFGDGGHGFQVRLPAAALRSGAAAVIVVRDAATGRQIGEDLPVEPAAAEPPAAATLAGSLDQVTSDGWVAGWCWYPDDPSRRVELAVLVDGAQVGTAFAADHRADIEQAGVGDGAHGFTFAIPWAVLAEKGEMTIAVRDRRTGAPLGDPVTLRIGAQAATEARIQDLERQVRVLQSEVEGYARQVLGRDEDRAARDLFRTVSAFFLELADTPPEDGFASAGLRGSLTAFTNRFAPVNLVAPHAPKATIIIDTRAATGVIHRCLCAIKSTGADMRAEIVLLDDGSQADVALLPAVTRNLRYHRLAPADTMIAARNAAAAEARGEIVVFLAGDTIPEPGWLDTLLDTFVDRPDAALVGARVLRADEMIDDAGSALPADLRARPIGRGESAELAEFSFMRPVDAVADRLFAARADAFRAAGGFSDVFRAGTAAVTDLCLRLRAVGHTVLCQPESVATRADPVASESELGDEDLRALRLRWRATMPSTHRFVGHALVVDSELPDPDRDAGSVFTFEQLLVLRDLGWRVTFAPVDAVFDDAAAIALLQRHGVEVARPPTYPSVTSVLRANGGSLDLVNVCRHAHGGLLLDRIRALAPGARTVFTPVDLHFLREEREAALTGRPATSEATRDRELACVAAADATILFSEHERSLLAAEVAPDRLHLLRYTTRVRADWPHHADRRDICFVGNFRHPPNVDGVIWFARDVLPLVWRHVPDLVFNIIGGGAPASVLELAGPRVIVHGWVKALTPMLDAMRLTVAPLRYGAGFKGKVATSLANGVPVVATTIAIEGTGLEAGDGVAVADTAADFAACVVSLYGTETVWTAQAARGIERCRALYSPAAARLVWRDLLARLGLPFRP